MLTLALLVELGGGRPLLSPEFDTYILSNQYQISNELARANPPPHGQYHGKSNAQYVQFSRPRARREGNEGRFDLTEQAGRASWLASFPQAGRVGERPLARGGPYTVREVRAVRASKAGGTRIPQLSFVSILERRASPQMPPTKPPCPVRANETLRRICRAPCMAGCRMGGRRMTLGLAAADRSWEH